MAEGITKFGAARRQFVTAIRLFFDNRDSVSVYTLAQNAREIFESLCSENELPTFRDEMKRANPSVDKDGLDDLIKGPRNFFKHANRDPYEVLHDFSDDLIDHVLLLALEDCMKVAGRLPFEGQVFQLWYFAVYPEKLSSDARLSWMPAIENQFPGFQTLSREQQKQAGRATIDKYQNDESLFLDPRTDSATKWNDNP